MRTISTKELIDCALDYYNKGLLTAQAPDPNKRLCRFEYQGRRCAIGACLTEKEIEEAYKRNIISFQYLPKIGIKFKGRYVAREIQTMHDTWANGGDGERKGFEKQFLDLLNSYKDKKDDTLPS